MKNLMLTGLVVFFACIANAQTFKKGDVIEINKNLSATAEVRWIGGRVVEVNLTKKAYVVRGVDNKLYDLPFIKEQAWMRRPVQALNASMAITAGSCLPTIEVVKQKLQEEFENDFSEYDTVVITYNAIEPQASFINTDEELGKVNTEVFPFNIDITVRLVAIHKDGTQRKINWQFKRKYFLLQGKEGSCELTVVEKEENLLSNI